MDSLVNNVPHGLRLRFTDSPGDVSIMQKTCREKTTWLLVWQLAINHSHLLWGNRESVWIKSMVEMWYAPLADRSRLTACTRLTQEDYSICKLFLIIIDALMIISFYASHFAFSPVFVPLKKHLILFSFPQMNSYAPPINYKTFNDFSVGAAEN